MAVVVSPKVDAQQSKWVSLFLLEGAVLQIAHDRVQLGHGIAHGCTRGKHHATPSGDLVQVSALAKHIAGFLRFAGG